MKKIKWRMNNLKKSFSRFYKGYSDVLGILLGISGFVIFGYGAFLVLCEEYTSIIIMTVGAIFLFGADDLFRCGRH